MFSFNGEDKVITVDTGITQFNVKELYSRWKDWVKLSDNSKFLPAFGDSIGGDDLGGGQFLGSYFFIINGWKIRPFEGDHTLTLDGNLFPRPATESAFTQTLGNFNVQIVQNKSSLTQAVATSGANEDQVARAVWNYLLSNSTIDGSTKQALETVLKNSKLIPALL